MTVWIVPEDVLRAVAVMDVEIDDRDALGAVGRLGVTRGDGRIVEEAKAHRRRDFGMMAGRARGDEGVSDLLGHHLVDCEYRAPCRAKGRLERAGRHRGVVVDGRAPLRRRPRADRLDIVERMDALDRRNLGPRRDVSRQHLEDLALQGPLDCAQTVRPLGMSLAHVMRQTRGVGDEERGDCLMSWLPKRISPQPARHPRANPREKSIGHNASLRDRLRFADCKPG